MRPLTYCLCALFIASTAMAADPALLGLVPADSGVIIGIDIDRISSTRFGQAIYSQMQAQSKDFTGLAGNAELELVRGVSELLLAAPVNNRGNRGVVLVRGSFTPAALQALAAGTTESSFQGVRILTRQQKQPLSIAILEPSLLLGGDPQSVRSAIARRSLPGSPDPVLTAQARELGASYDIWLVAGGGLAGLAPQKPPSQFGALAGNLEKSIQQLGAGVKFGPMLQISVDVATRTDKDATAMADALKMLIGLAASGKNAQQVKPMLDSLQLRVEANTVKLNIVIPEDQLMATMQPAGTRRTRMTGRSPELVIQGSSPQNAGVTIQSSPSDMGVVTLPAPKPQ